MTSAEVRAHVVRALQAIAPEVDVAALRGDVPLRGQVDLDSVDWLHVLLAVHEATGVDIPETEYVRLATLDALVAYVAGHVRAV